jgi:hypothetical protein
MPNRNAALFGVVLLFAFCGAASSWLAGDLQGWRFEILPVPFGTISAVLFLRSPKAILVVPLYILVYCAAFYVAMDMAISRTPRNDYLPMCVGGLIGGFGVCLASGIANRCLLYPRYLLGACLVGCVAALPFGLWLAAANRVNMNAHDDAFQPLRLACSYAIWQAAVGTYLYGVCARSKRERGARTVVL